MAAYGQPVSSRVQSQAVTCTATAWTALTGGATALISRTGVEIYNKGAAASVKLYLSYNNTISVKYCKPVETGAYHFEPCGSQLTLYGRTQAATARVIVTEYGN